MIVKPRRLPSRACSCKVVDCCQISRSMADSRALYQIQILDLVLEFSFTEDPHIKKILHSSSKTKIKSAYQGLFKRSCTTRSTYLRIITPPLESICREYE